MRTKTKTSIRTKLFIGAVALALAAGGFGSKAMAKFGPGITVSTQYTGESTYVRGFEDFELLAFSMKARGIDINVSEINFDIIGNDDPDITPVVANIDTEDFIMQCTLVDASSGYTLMGPSPVSGDRLRLADDFSISTGSTQDLSLRCDFANTSVTSGTDDVFIAKIADENDIVYENASTGALISSSKTQLGIIGKGINTNGGQARVRYIDHGKMTAILSSSSPSGASVPGNMEVLRFNLSAEESNNAYVDSILFEIQATDNKGSGWNNCSTLTGSDFTLYNLSSSSSSALSATRTVKQDDGSSCASGSATHFVAFNLSTPISITAGETQTLALFMDTAGVSAVDDDMIRIEIPSETSVDSLVTPLDSMSWYDDGGSALDGYDVYNLPLIGNTLLF